MYRTCVSRFTTGTRRNAMRTGDLGIEVHRVSPGTRGDRTVERIHPEPAHRIVNDTAAVGLDAGPEEREPAAVESAFRNARIEFRAAEHEGLWRGTRCIEKARDVFEAVLPVRIHLKRVREAERNARPGSRSSPPRLWPPFVSRR